MGKLPFGLPSTEAVADTAVRRFLDAVAANLRAWAGESGDRRQWLVSRDDLVKASVVGHDDLGRLYPVVTKPASSAMTNRTRATVSDVVVSGLRVGSQAIASGVDLVTVTGLGLAAVPSVVLAAVITPTSTTPGSFRITAHVVDDTLTTDGFTVSLSGTTDSAGYRLAYVTMN